MLHRSEHYRVIGKIAILCLLVGTLLLLASRLGKTTNVDHDNPNEPWIEQISWQPRIFLFHHFMTKEECQEILSLAKGDVARSLVVGEGGKSVESEGRSSSGVFLTRKYMTQSPLLRNIERRISEWTQLPIENGEGFYLIRYEIGQQYKPHYDWFSLDEKGKPHIGSSGNRVATVLSYLQEPEEGGETIFPLADAGKIEVKVNTGDAVLFFDYTPSGEPDHKALHGSNPVIKGEKWSMTKWLRPRVSRASWKWELPQKEDEELTAEEFARFPPKKELVHSIN